MLGESQREPPPGPPVCLATGLPLRPGDVPGHEGLWRPLLSRGLAGPLTDLVTSHPGPFRCTALRFRGAGEKTLGCRSRSQPVPRNYTLGSFNPESQL